MFGFIPTPIHVIGRLSGITSRDNLPHAKNVIGTSSVLTLCSYGPMGIVIDHPLIVIAPAINADVGYFSPHTVYFRARNHVRCQKNMKIARYASN